MGDCILDELLPHGQAAGSAPLYNMKALPGKVQEKLDGGTFFKARGSAMEDESCRSQQSAAMIYSIDVKKNWLQKYVMG